MLYVQICYLLRGNRDNSQGALLTSQAFRRLAKVHHPDKGGDAVMFGRIQHAFQVLSDSQKRAVYDTWARELQFRYVRGVAAKVGLQGTAAVLNSIILKRSIALQACAARLRAA